MLDIKGKQEQIKTQELFALTGKLAAKRGELLTQQGILKEIMRKISEEKADERLREQEFFLRYCSTTDEHIKKLTGELAELESLQRKKITEVLKVRRFKQGLERLREEAKRRFIEQQERIEQKQLDETAAVGFRQRQCGDVNS